MRVAHRRAIHHRRLRLVSLAARRANARVHSGAGRELRRIGRPATRSGGPWVLALQRRRTGRPGLHASPRRAAAAPRLSLSPPARMINGDRPRARPAPLASISAPHDAGPNPAAARPLTTGPILPALPPAVSGAP